MTESTAPPKQGQLSNCFEICIMISSNGHQRALARMPKCLDPHNKNMGHIKHFYRIANICQTVVKPLLNRPLYKIGYVHWHLINFRIIIFLNVIQNSSILLREKIYRNTLPTKTASTTNSMNVIFPVNGQIIINDK